MIHNMLPQDTPFMMFSVFTGDNKVEYTSILFLLDEMTRESYREAVPYTYFAEEAERRGLFGGDGREERINAHIRRLAASKLVRRQIVYNDETKEWEDSVLLSGYGRKFVSFIKDISRTDLDETKDYQITNVRRNMRDLASRRALPENRADLLMAAFSGLRDLIYHLSNFNSEFTDYMVRENRSQIKSAREAGAWINRIMGSKYMVEFYTICDDSLGYVSQISEIAINTKKIYKSSELTGMIIRDRKKKAEELRKKHIDDISESEIEKEVDMQLRRILSIANTEYRTYVMQITNTVTAIIRRTFMMYSAFGAEIAGDNLLARIMQTLRYIEETGDERVLDDIMNLYSLRYYTENSLTKPSNRADDEKEYPVPDYAFNDKVETGKRFVTKSMRIKGYLRSMMADNECVRLDSLPCGNDKEFMMLVSLVRLATERESPAKEYRVEYISGEPTTCRKGIYTIPNVYIRKRRNKQNAGTRHGGGTLERRRDG